MTKYSYWPIFTCSCYWLGESICHFEAQNQEFSGAHGLSSRYSSWKYSRPHFGIHARLFLFGDQLVGQCWERCRPARVHLVLSFDQLTHSLIIMMIITSLSRSSPPASSSSSSSPPASSCSHWCRVEDSWLLRDPNLLLIKFQRNWENFNLADICLKYMREISNNLRLNLL